MKLDFWYDSEARGDKVFTAGEFTWVWHEGDELRAGTGLSFGNDDPTGLVVAVYNRESGTWRPMGAKGEEFTDFDVQAEQTASGMQSVELRHIPENRWRLTAGYEWVTLTYTDLRGKLSGDTEEGHTIATFHDGFWVTSDGQEWTDIDIDIQRRPAPPMMYSKAPELRFGLADLLEAAQGLSDELEVDSNAEYNRGVVELIMRMLETDQSKMHFADGVGTGERRNYVRRMLGWPEGE